MNVTISVFGRFHAFYLAHQLYKRDHLSQLITSYPKFEVEKYGIPREVVSSLLPYEACDRLWNRWLPKKLKPKIDITRHFNESFGKAAAACLQEDTDIYVGWSSKSAAGLKKARALGAVTILERGSSHPEYHRDVLVEEYETYGLKEKADFQKVNYRHEAIHEYELTDYISVPSEFAKRTFVERGFPSNRIITVPYGVDLSQFRPLPKESDVFRVIFAGGMSLRKGVHYLLQAFSELKLPNSELWLIGTKNPEIESTFKKYEGSFRYFGHIPQPDLHRYYSQGSVFVMPSLEEGLALVQPQAMACGLPLVCTTNTGGEDLIEDGKEGFVIPIRSVEAIKEKLVWLFENPEACQEMGRAARNKVRTGFSWDDYGEKITQSYLKVLNRK